MLKVVARAIARCHVAVVERSCGSRGEWWG